MTEPDYKGFALAVIGDFPEMGLLDGFDIQEMGEKYGLLRLENRTEPCSEECNCTEYYSLDEMANGFDCYRKVWVTDSEEQP